MSTHIPQMTHSLAPRQKAFTLLELLAVIAIIGLLAGLVVPAFSHLAESSKLTNAATQLANELNYAQQLAIKNNVPTSVVFYSYKNSTNADTTPRFQAFQTWVQAPNQALNTYAAYRPGSKVMPLPEGIIISYSSTYSTVLSNHSATAPATFASSFSVPSTTSDSWSPASSNGGTELDHTYFKITFYPDGSTDLVDPPPPPGTDSSSQPSYSWCITLYPGNYSAAAANPGGATTGPAPNFVTLVIDSMNGNIRVYRPG